MAKKLCVALLSGGISSEREVSLSGGGQAFESLDKEKYEVRRFDPKFDLMDLARQAGEIDVALLILHGPFGEDGRLQGFLDMLGIPYQGAGVLGSALAMHKLVSKKLYRAAGIPTPAWACLNQNDDPQKAMVDGGVTLPVVVKPASGGSSVGMSVVREAKSLPRALEQAFEQDREVLLEQYIKGREITVGVLGNDRLQALPVVEVIPGEEFDFFDYQAKYQPGATREVCPAPIGQYLTHKAQQLAIEAHQALSARGCSRTDFMLADDRLFALETNTIPGMTPTSLLPQAAKQAGYSFSQLLDRLIELALEGPLDGQQGL